MRAILEIFTIDSALEEEIKSHHCSLMYCAQEDYISLLDGSCSIGCGLKFFSVQVLRLMTLEF